MTKLIRVTVLATLVAAAGLASAKGTPPVQNHHCKMPDGTMDNAKTHKECTAAKGTWAKDAPAKDAPAKDAPAKDAPKGATPAPAPAPTPAPKKP